MSPTSSFAELMARLKQGDQEAATAIHRRIVGRLIRAVQEEVASKYAAKIDVESVVQSAFATFCEHRADDRYADLASWEQLWALLLTMARHKLADRLDRFRAACRDVHREVSLDTLRDQAGQAQEPIDPNPTPAEVASLAEQVERMIQTFAKRDPEQGLQCRRIITLRLQGYSKAQISEIVGCAERTVTRTLKEARRRLEKMLCADEEEEKP